MKKTSIKDVAREAGVSTALVSYVVNGRLTHRINKETAQRIRQVIRQLNYQPNRIAQSLKLQKSYTIGLVVPDIANPFSSSVARLVEDVASQQGYTLVIGSSDEKASKLETLVNSFLNRQVDGFIIGNVEGGDDFCRSLVDKKIPAVFIDRPLPSPDACMVSIDNFFAAHQATAYLLQTGMQKPGFVTYQSELYNLRERERGYRAALEEQGKQNNVAIGRAAISDLDQQMPALIDAMLKQSVDALFFSANKLAIAALKYLIRKDLRVPAQLSVIAFDESDAFDLFYAPLTYIRQPLDEMAHRAVTLLLAQINGETPPETNIVLKSTLVERDSTLPVSFHSFLP